ncbi:MAG TPA: response regulator, partial [Chroococcales cyanobacterium]
MTKSATTVLIVEDNAADARYAEELLPGGAYKFVEAKTLAQAVECLNQKDIDVILLDLSLPDSLGLQTVSYLVERSKELPIVVLTGLDDIASATEAVRAGAHDYMIKARLTADSLIKSLDHAI